MQSKEDMQKYIDEMMRLYSQNPNANAAAPAQRQMPPPQMPPPMPTPPGPRPNEQNNLPTPGIPILPLEPIEVLDPAAPAFPIGEGYTETGYLQVDITSGERAFPIEDAVVVITRKTPLGQTVMSITATDGNGRTPIIPLPAPDIANQNDMNTPFASYTAEIFLKGYHTVINENVPIFADITSILPVNMVPLPTNASNRREITFYSNEPQF